MKQFVDEIQADRRPQLVPMLVPTLPIVTFALGALLSAVLLDAFGIGSGSPTVHSGALSYLEVQDSPNSRTGYSYTEEEQVRGRLTEHHLVIDRPDSVEVIPAERLYQLRFRD